MEIYLLFVPTHYPDVIPLSLLSGLQVLGFFGVFALLSIKFLEKAPLMPFGDLYIQNKYLDYN